MPNEITGLGKIGPTNQNISSCLFEFTLIIIIIKILIERKMYNCIISCKHLSRHTLLCMNIADSETFLVYSFLTTKSEWRSVYSSPLCKIVITIIIMLKY